MSFFPEIMVEFPIPNQNLLIKYMSILTYLEVWLVSYNFMCYTCIFKASKVLHWS